MNDVFVNEPTTVVDTEQLKKLLFSNVCAVNPIEKELVRQAQNRLFNRCTIEGVFRPALYSSSWSNVHIILKNSKMFDEVDYAYKNWNPLNDYNFEFLGEKNGEYAIIYTR